MTTAKPITGPVVAYRDAKNAEFLKKYKEWDEAHECDARALAVGTCWSCEAWVGEWWERDARTSFADWAKVFEWEHEKALEEHLRRDRAEQERAALASGTASPLPPI